MSLGIGSSVARSGLAVAADQIATVSRNISRASDPNASRKTAIIVTGPGSGVRTATYVRSANPLLLDNYLTSNSATGAQAAIADALTQLDATAGDTADERSIASYVGRLTNALQQASSSPSNISLAGAAVTAANDLAKALNSASQTTIAVRREADGGVAQSVERINSLLVEFGELNSQVIEGSRNGGDVTDALDARDAVLKELSEEIGINTIGRADGGMAIYTDSGVTLFETKARAVTFQPQPSLSAGGAAGAVYVDGVPVAGTPGVMPLRSGRITGLIAVRDGIAPVYQAQLDEIARGLIEAFAETDQSGGAAPLAAGLFTYSGAPAVPGTGIAIAGLASDIRIAASVDPAQGGDARLLRDGAISNPGNPAYRYNGSGAASYSDRLSQFIDLLGQARSFDGAAQTTTSASIGNFASSSVSWLQNRRQASASDLEYRAALSQRAGNALSSETGVNLDEEMAHMLELERSYQASARVISAIDQLLQTLLQVAS